MARPSLYAQYPLQGLPKRRYFVDFYGMVQRVDIERGAYVNGWVGGWMDV